MPRPFPSTISPNSGSGSLLVPVSIIVIMVSLQSSSRLRQSNGAKDQLISLISATVNSTIHKQISLTAYATRRVGSYPTAESWHRKTVKKETFVYHLGLLYDAAFDVERCYNRSIISTRGIRRFTRGLDRRAVLKQ